MLFLLDFDTSCNSVLVGLTLVLALWGRKHQGNTCGHHPWFSIYRSVNQHFWGIPPERQRFLIFNQQSTGWIFIIPANQKCISSPSLWTSQVALPFDVLWRFVHWGKKKVHICTVGACKASLYESPTAYLIDFNGPLFNLNTIINCIFSSGSKRWHTHDDLAFLLQLLQVMAQVDISCWVQVFRCVLEEKQLIKLRRTTQR